MKVRKKWNYKSKCLLASRKALRNLERLFLFCYRDAVVCLSAFESLKKPEIVLIDQGENYRTSSVVERIHNETINPREFISIIDTIIAKAFKGEATVLSVHKRK